ncbi:MAG TPA: phosphoribosyltransferase family protein [Opitutaceae bacterium]|nr:phosphoribosyltransferase family protein [Opitutaceae bacterium]
MEPEIFSRMPARKGHFKYESGYHGDLWLDLDTVFLRPAELRPYIVELAQKLSTHPIDAVCGPMVGGAFLAQMVAAELDLEYFYAERFAPTARAQTLFPVTYLLPTGLRNLASGKTFAIVDDVISAGSAVRGAFTDLKACGALPTVFGALLLIGNAIPTFVAEHHLGLEYIGRMEKPLWKPADCPLCSAGVPLEDLVPC